MKAIAIGLDVVDGGEAVTVSGEIDASNIAAMESVIRASGAVRPGPVLVDLTGVSFADFASVERLLAVREELLADGVVVRLEPVSQAVARVISLLELVEALRQDSDPKLEDSRLARLDD